MKSALKNQYQALPTYLGGKRSLNPWIFSNLNQCVPTAYWPELTFIDAFMGGGAVSLYAKAQGFSHLYANDWSFRSQIIGNAFLENQRIRLSKLDMLSLTQALPKEHPPGLIKSHYCPSVFSTRHAEALDRILYGAYQLQDQCKHSLALTVLWHMASRSVCFPTSLGTSNRPYAEALDGLRDWESINPKRFVDGSIERLLTPTWQDFEKLRLQINRGIFGGSPASVSQLDVFDFLRGVSGDIVYFDPPYAQTVSYEKANSVLDAILQGKVQAQTPASSLFTGQIDILDTLFETARHVPIWVISYGNKVLSLEDLKAKVQRHRPNHEILAVSKGYKHLAHVSKQNQCQELLVIAYPKKGG